MAGRAKKRPLSSKVAHPHARSKKHLIDARDAQNLQATASPARELMSRLAIEHAIDHDAGEDRWSARRAALFIALSCSALWVGLYLIAKAVF